MLPVLHIYKFDIENLKNKGIIVECIDDKEIIDQLKRKWLNTFVNNYIKFRDVGVRRRMWEAFYHNAVECYCREEAVEKFNKQVKSECYIIADYANDGLMLNNAWDLKYEDLEDFHGTDFYVVSKRINWTFAGTHELHLGPYFYHTPRQ